MEKTAKITSVEENVRQYSGKVPMFIHKIRFENDPENKIWEYHSSNEKCDKFKEGEVATFTTKVEVSGQYTNYRIFPKSEPSSGKNYGGRPEKKDEGVITYLSCFSSVCNLYANKQYITDDEVFEMTEKAFQKAVAKSNKNQ